MKRFALVAALLFSGAAFAQLGLVEVQPAETLPLSKGETKILRFNDPINEVVVMSKGIIETKAITDKQLAISAIGHGTARVVVFSNNGNQILDNEVVVAPEPGRIVKIYGQVKDDDLGAGYTAHFCNEFGCGRPDYDMPKASSVTVQRFRYR